MTVKKTCKDCRSEGLPLTRPAPKPGPRCATHHREVVKARRQSAREKYVAKAYSIDEDFYQAMYREQGGASAICQWAKGTGRKRLSVDHDHKCCPGPVSCGKCVRGLLDKSCNRDILGHLRDDPLAFVRGLDYLIDPPAHRVRRAKAGTPLVLNVDDDTAHELLAALDPIIKKLK